MPVYFIPPNIIRLADGPCTDGPYLLIEERLPPWESDEMKAKMIFFREKLAREESEGKIATRIDIIADEIIM